MDPLLPFCCKELACCARGKTVAVLIFNLSTLKRLFFFRISPDFAAFYLYLCRKAATKDSLSV